MAAPSLTRRVHMISTRTPDGLLVQLTWTEVRNLIAAIMVDQGDGFGIDDEEQFEMINITSAESQWVAGVVTTLNDALADAGKRPWQKDQG